MMIPLFSAVSQLFFLASLQNTLQEAEIESALSEGHRGDDGHVFDRGGHRGVDGHAIVSDGKRVKYGRNFIESEQRGADGRLHVADGQQVADRYVYVGDGVRGVESDQRVMDNLHGDDAKSYEKDGQRLGKDGQFVGKDGRVSTTYVKGRNDISREKRSLFKVENSDTGSWAKWSKCDASGNLNDSSYSDNILVSAGRILIHHRHS